jgi:hypothetical protein
MTDEGAHPVQRKRVWKAALCFAALLPASPAWSQREAPGRALTASSFMAISFADLEKIGLGCSFAAFRGKELIAISLGDQAGKPQFWFKIDGALVKVTGKASKRAKTQSLGVWSGKVAGSDVRITEGRIDPNFRNDGGSIGGAGRIAWRRAGRGGAMPIRWEWGC